MEKQKNTGSENINSARGMAWALLGLVIGTGIAVIEKYLIPEISRTIQCFSFMIPLGLGILGLTKELKIPEDIKYLFKH